MKGTSKNGDGIVYLNVIKPMFRLLPFIALFSRKVLQKCPALYEECFNNYRTVPQIFIGDTFIGGFDELNQMNQQGKLDELLAG